LSLRTGADAPWSETAEFNRKYPTWPILPDTIMRSINQHVETSRGMVDGVTINPKLKDYIDQKYPW
jgi:hypothetical protein